MPSIVPFPFHKCYLFFFIFEYDFTSTFHIFNAKKMLIIDMYLKVQWDQGLHIWSGAQRRPNYRCKQIMLMFMMLILFMVIFSMIIYDGCLIHRVHPLSKGWNMFKGKMPSKILTHFYISFSSRTLQPDSLEREQTAWCGSGSKRRKGLTSPSPSAIIDHNLMVILNSYCNTHTRWS